MFPAEEDQRKSRDALRLHKRDHFKKLIQGAKTARHENEPHAVFHKAHLAREEIMEMDGDVRITIAGLFVRQFDIQANGFAAGLHGLLGGRAALGRLGLALLQ